MKDLTLLPVRISLIDNYIVEAILPVSRHIAGIVYSKCAIDEELVNSDILFCTFGEEQNNLLAQIEQILYTNF